MLQPNEVQIKKVSETQNTSVFSFKPLPKGYGHTLGNSIRRVLLTSIKGAAITSVKFEGANHQFTTLPGVKQDVVEITLNLKKVIVKSHSEHPVIGTISKKGKGSVTAGDIQVSSEVEIINKDFVIAELADDKSKFDAEIVIESGVGYRSSEGVESAKLGTILIDALFSPIVHVSYDVKPTRKGEVTDLDELLLNITTDGSVSAEDALTESANLLTAFFRRFSDGEDEVAEETVIASPASDDSSEAAGDDIFIEDLTLPTRTINALKKHGIERLSQLAKMGPEEMADIKNLGEKSVEEINKLLEKEGLK